MKGYFEEENLKERSDTNLIRLILPFLKPYSKLIITSVITITIITALNLVVPYITMYSIDNYIIPKKSSTISTNSIDKTKRRYLSITEINDQIKEIVRRNPDLFIKDGKSIIISYENLNKLNSSDIRTLRFNDLYGVKIAALVLLILVLTSFICEFAQMMIIQLIGQNIMHDFRMRIFSHIQSKEIEYFTKNSVGRLVTRVTNDVSNMQEMFTSILTFVFKDFIMLFGIIIILLSINLKLSLFTFIILPVIIIVAFIFAKYSRESFRTLRIKVAEINSGFSETIGGINIIQLFKQESSNYKKLKDLNHQNYIAGMNQIHIFALFMPIIELLGTLTLAIIIYYGGTLVLSENLTIGILVAFTSYLRMFFRPIRDIAEKYNILQNALSSAERIFLIFDDKEITNEKLRGGEEQLNKIKKIEFDNVSFNYSNSKKILKNISFTINKGETIAIVGPTGSGKTTLINLIERFYNNTEGSIKINGIDINNYDIGSIRKKTSVVMQNPFLFSSSIRDNISGQSTLSEDKINKIIDDSNCRNLISKLENGLDSILSEEGESISSGERQLISIARAFAMEPELIILDEATSYVDSDSEWKINEAIQNLMKERTTIIVAHRLLTAATADKILVLNNGRLVETGSHSELMKKKEFYYNLKVLE